ncbi:hypothetical protein M378DRAFT_1029668 [Amanita muscaria Koide BX008]|uniref:Uncharacterized protein n=1 Tax=Amanita muscaria (strain Koide BX008) TaxID=946122 RepID=A0A0C2WLY0_AMAMK|nr:hypothetical protein M378DRAFT_1029668 [Amanita muscaria Koide BX008]
MREERARDAERKKQEALRIQERHKLENVIQERDEREQALQEQLNVLEDEQQVFAMQTRKLMEHSEFLKNQNCKTFEDQVRDSSTAHLSCFLNSNSIKMNKSVEQEVIMLLDILNSEVYQAAACIADLLETRSQLLMTSGPGGAEESRLTKVIGKGLMEVLKARADRAHFPEVHGDSERRKLAGENSHPFVPRIVALDSACVLLSSDSLIPTMSESSSYSEPSSALSTVVQSHSAADELAHHDTIWAVQ